MFEDKTLVCKDCGQEFVFTAGEQEFYASRGFENEPQRCKACRDARKNATRGTREMFTAVCASCGKEARVPFKPREDRPVYLQRVLRKDERAGLISLLHLKKAAFQKRPFLYKNRPGHIARGDLRYTASSSAEANWLLYNSA